MNIVCHEDNTGHAPKGERFTAIDDDRYDGVLDGCTTRGIGATPEAAIADLIEQLEDE